jgi:hypothetical protein
MKEILTHGGVLLASDYLTVFFAFFVTVLLQMNSAQKQHESKFKIITFCIQNWLRWLLSVSSALFLLYTLPDGYFWYMESYLKSNEKGTTEWNITLSAIIGLSPLYILKKLIKVSRTKLDEK